MKSPHRPVHLHGRLFRASNQRLTPDELRSHAWRRLQRDIYADAALAPSHGLRCAGVHLRMPGAAAIGGRSAAWLWGVQLVGDGDPVEVVTPPTKAFGPMSGVVIRTTDLPGEDVVPNVPRLTTPERTAWDIARFTPTAEAVAYLDAMVAARLVSPAELQDRIAAGNRWGRRRAQLAASLVDPRSESPQESRLRAHLVLAGLPRPYVQHSVFVGRQFVARVDLAWPELRVAVEYDGAHHGAQLHADRRRLNRLVSAGWTVLHVTSVRLHGEVDQVVAEVRAALARAAGLQR